MILILSTKDDINTNGVIEWLRHFNTPFVRLNDEDILNGDVQVCYSLSNNKFIIKGSRKIMLKDIKVVWFRKFGFLYSYEKFFNEFDKTSKTSSMARTTGYTCTAVANLVIEGKYDKKGVSPPEFLGEHFNEVNKYLEDRNVIYNVRKKELKINH